MVHSPGHKKDEEDEDLFVEEVHNLRPEGGKGNPNNKPPPEETATDEQIQGVNSILGGVKWSDAAVADPTGTDPLKDGLTYSFPLLSSDYELDPNNGNAEGYPEVNGNHFLALTEAEGGFISPIFTELNQFMGVTIRENTDPIYNNELAAGDADIRIAKTSYITDSDDAWAYYPGEDKGGDVWINPTLGPAEFGGDPDFSNDGTLLPGGYNYGVYMHEIGHALGLGHPDGDNPDGVTAPDGKDFLAYTIMANNAFDSIETGAIDGWTYSAEDTPSTFMQYDIAALQYMYGTDYGEGTVIGGDTFYQWDPGTSHLLGGGLKITGEVVVDDDGNEIPVYEGGDYPDPASGTNNIYMTIWDGGGIDTYDFSNYEVDITIDLRPGEWIAFEDTTGLPVDDYTNSQRANLWSRDEGPQTEPIDPMVPNSPEEIINWAPGNIANALVFDFNTEDGHADAGWIENAWGGSGDDTFYGNAVANTFTGNGGEDTFVLTDFDPSDLISDYTFDGDQGDIIDITDLLNIVPTPEPGGNLDNFVQYNATTYVLQIDADGLANGSSFADAVQVEASAGFAATNVLILFDDAVAPELATVV